MMLLPQSKRGFLRRSPRLLLVLNTLASADPRSENIRVLSVVVAELKLSDVQREILARYFVERAHDAALEDAPEAFNRVRVDRADNVLLGLVAHGVVRIIWRETTVGAVFVCAE